MNKYKEIPGWQGRYKVSRKGYVINTLNQTKRHGILTSKGYIKVKLTLNGRTEQFRMHRLVAEAFIPNPDNLPEVNHKDSDKTNNHVENLEWVTTSENQCHHIKNTKELNSGRVRLLLSQIKNLTVQELSEFHQQYQKIKP